MLDAQNVDKVLRLHEAFVDAPFTVRAERRLILQGNLCRVTLSSRSVGEERKYILFTDMLVYVKPMQQKGTTRLQYKGHIVLDRAKVRLLSKEEAGGIAHCFELTPSHAGVDSLNTTFVSTAPSFVLYVGSDEERKEWISKLTDVIDNLDRLAMIKQGKKPDLEWPLFGIINTVDVAHANRKRIQDLAPKGSAIASVAASVNSLSLDDSNKSSSSKESFYTN